MPALLNMGTMIWGRRWSIVQRYFLASNTYGICGPLRWFSSDVIPPSLLPLGHVVVKLCGKPSESNPCISLWGVTNMSDTTSQSQCVRRKWCFTRYLL